ncbi:MAG: PAS domain S-box protein [Myxococcota bacterium]
MDPRAFAFDGSAQAIVVVGADGRVRDLNAAAARLVGQDASVVRGTRALAWVAPEDRRRAGEAIARVAAGGSPERIRIGVGGGAGTWELRQCGDDVVAFGPIAGNRLHESAALLGRIAAAANEARDVPDALGRAMAALCAYTRWPFAHALAVEGDEIRSMRLWHGPTDQIRSFREASEGMVFRRGLGLPGRVIERGRAVWVVDTRVDPLFPRRNVALPAGLRGAFAFPVRAGAETVAIVEFFSRRRVAPDPALLSLVEQAGTQLGRVFERVRAEEALKKSSRAIADILERAGDAWIAMDAEGRVVDWNRKATATFGWSREEAVGRLLGELIVPEALRAAHRRGVARFLATGEARLLGRRVEVEGMDRTGRSVPIELVIWVAGEGPDGRPLFNAFLRDVTERREADRALRDALADARLAYAELEAVSSAVSHDLRAPLRAIDGFTRLLAESFGPDLGPERADWIARTHRAVGRMSALIDALLRLLQVSQGEVSRVDVDLGELAADALTDLRERDSRHDVTLVVAGPVRARCDPRLVRTLLHNLLRNAWEATRDVAGPMVRVGVDADGAFYVADNGRGFDMAWAARLFVPFDRLQAPVEGAGAGIGLAIARRIVERHGGRIWAEATPGTGATFRFTLPSTGDAATATRAASPGSAPRTSGSSRP